MPFSILHKVLQGRCVCWPRRYATSSLNLERDTHLPLLLIAPCVSVVGGSATVYHFAHLASRSSTQFLTPPRPVDGQKLETILQSCRFLINLQQTVIKFVYICVRLLAFSFRMVWQKSMLLDDCLSSCGPREFPIGSAGHRTFTVKDRIIDTGCDFVAENPFRRANANIL